MKKVLIAVIGSNCAYGVPLHNQHHTFDLAIKTIIKNGIITLSKKTYDALPSKSPPFPNHTTYIVSTEPVALAPGLRRTFVVPSLAVLFEKLADNGAETLFIFLDNTLYNEMFTMYKDEIDTVIVAKLNKKFSSDEIFENPSAFAWRPLLIACEEDKGTRSPGFEIHEYKKSTLHL